MKTELVRVPFDVELTKKITNVERRMTFPEIMDAAEKCGKLVIVSTNLGESELRERYGDRILDRIKALTFRVCFNGESLRGTNN